MPSGSGVDSRVRPGRSIGTRKALTPRPPAPNSVAAKTSATSAAAPLATHTLRPRSRYSSPAAVAVVSCRAASVPACASDRANAPMTRPDASLVSHCSFCSAVPKRWSTSATSELLTTRMAPSVALAAATASTANA